MSGMKLPAGARVLDGDRRLPVITCPGWVRQQACDRPCDRRSAGPPGSSSTDPGPSRRTMPLRPATAPDIRQRVGPIILW